jgi:hypothetical protein
MSKKAADLAIRRALAEIEHMKSIKTKMDWIDLKELGIEACTNYDPDGCFPTLDICKHYETFKDMSHEQVWKTAGVNVLTGCPHYYMNILRMLLSEYFSLKGGKNDTEGTEKSRVKMGC